MVTVSRHVIRVENTVVTSNFEASEVGDLNGTMSNYFLSSLLVLTYFLPFPSSEYVNMIKRLQSYVENCYTCSTNVPVTRYSLVTRRGVPVDELTLN